MTAVDDRIGGSPNRVGGIGRVTGTQAYLADLDVADALHAKLVTVPCARARIVSVDARAALAMPGVHLVMTAGDLPQPVPRFGPQHVDRPVLATGETKYHGDPVAVVVADTRDLAELAAAAVRVEPRSSPPCSPWPARWPRTRHWSRTRRCAPGIPGRRPTSSPSTGWDGATSRRRRGWPTSSSRAATPSRWSPTSPSSPTRSWRRPMATG